MRIGGARCAPPPSQTVRADLPHTAFRSAVFDGLAQAGVPRCSEGTRQPRSPYVPWLHDHITRFFATPDAPTPTGPLAITCPGSLIHVTRTSHHSLSNHLRLSARRVPLPQRWPLYFVRASPCARRLARTADPIQFALSAPSDGHHYGLVVHFQLLSTRGYRPDAVTLSCCPYSVGQVRDLHPAVPVRSQAHERPPQAPPQITSERKVIMPREPTN